MDKTIEFLQTKNKNKTPEEIYEERVLYAKKIFENKKVKLDRIGDYESWGHEHCEFCFKKLEENDSAYLEEDGYYWICPDCCEEHKDELNIKEVLK